MPGASVKLRACVFGLLSCHRLAYSYDLNCWQIMEGVTSAKKHPSQLYWNIIRFNPAYALAEMLMGVVAVRFVMLDGLDGEVVLLRNIYASR